MFWYITQCSIRLKSTESERFCARSHLNNSYIWGEQHLIMLSITVDYPHNQQWSLVHIQRTTVAHPLNCLLYILNWVDLFWADEICVCNYFFSCCSVCVTMNSFQKVNKDISWLNKKVNPDISELIKRALGVLQIYLV